MSRSARSGNRSGSWSFRLMVLRSPAATAPLSSGRDPALKSRRAPSMEIRMTRALVAVLLLAIPFITSVVLGRRAGHPDAGT